MKKKDLFKIDTILSEDVLGEDTLSLITGGVGAQVPCSTVIINCPKNSCSGNTGCGNLMLPSCPTLGCTYSSCSGILVTHSF